ncbi:MAG: hypothetical protein QOC58_247 [Mycobacterium sp.]|nr:hypothetical protein [Mycobacterium sp.]
MLTAPACTPSGLCRAVKPLTPRGFAARRTGLLPSHEPNCATRCLFHGAAPGRPSRGANTCAACSTAEHGRAVGLGRTPRSPAWEHADAGATEGSSGAASRHTPGAGSHRSAAAQLRRRTRTRATTAISAAPVAAPAQVIGHSPGVSNGAGYGETMSSGGTARDICRRTMPERGHSACETSVSESCPMVIPDRCPELCGGSMPRSKPNGRKRRSYH